MAEELVRLEDFEGELDEEWREVRGKKVMDSAGGEVGSVEDAYVWTEAPAVHLVKASAEGKSFLIPTDALTNVDEEGITVETGTNVILAAPEYASEDVPDAEARRAAFEHFGYVDQLALSGE